MSLFVILASGILPYLAISCLTLLGSWQFFLGRWQDSWRRRSDTDYLDSTMLSGAQRHWQILRRLCAMCHGIPWHSMASCFIDGHKSSWCVPCDNVGTVGRESVEYRRNYDKPLVAIGGHRQQSKRDKVGAEAKRFEFMTLFHSLSSGSLYPPTKCVGYGMLRPNTLI